MIDAPSVCVIIVNYNGKHYLPACLTALQEQTYPKDCYEVVVSDNGSQDGSLTLLREQFPWVRVLDNGKNLGFSSGNNVAIRQSKGNYVVLLNNDTVPSPTWLEELIKVAEMDSCVGIVTGHLQLFYDQLDVQLKIVPLGDNKVGESCNLRVYEIDSSTPRGVVQFLDGFSGWERDNSGGPYRNCGMQSLIGIPVPWGQTDILFKVKLASVTPVNVTVLIDDQPITSWQVSGQTPDWFNIALPGWVRNLSYPLEQNTGSIIFKNGAGRDRGTFVRNTDVLFEKNEGRYNQVEEVFAGCGASLLLKRTMLDDIGLLDDRFFMYYEDTDLSWRARIRGWKVIFAPSAEVRHIHCGTTKEWSPFFNFLVERNRLAMVFKNGGMHQVLHVWGGYGFKFARIGWRMLMNFLGHQEWRSQAREFLVHLKIILSLIIWQPYLWINQDLDVLPPFLLVLAYG